MAIQPLSMIRPASGMMNIDAGIQRTPYEAQQSFGNFLKEAINEVNNKQIESDKMTQKLVLGGDVELHDVMIAAQKASIALNATMEVRNKVVEAYQEIIRMPV